MEPGWRLRATLLFARGLKQLNPSLSAFAIPAVVKEGGEGLPSPAGSGFRSALALRAGFRPGPESRPSHGVPVGAPVSLTSPALDRVLLVPS